MHIVFFFFFGGVHNTYNEVRSSIVQAYLRYLKKKKKRLANNIEEERAKEMNTRNSDKNSIRRHLNEHALKK